MKMENEDTLEAMLARGEIHEIGEVVIEEEPEIEIPVYIGDERICDGEVPDLVVFKAGLESKTPNLARIPAVPAYRGVGPQRSVITAKDAQARLRSLPGRLGFGEPGIGSRMANIFAVTTERQKIQAFGDYLAELIGRTPCCYVDPAGFVALVNIAAINLQKGLECGTGRPVRQGLREVLSCRDPLFYDDLVSRTQQIARAIATAGSGFASEVDGIY